MCTLWNFNITLMNTAVMGNAFGLVMKSAFMMTGGGVFFLMAVVFFTTKRLSRASHAIAAITELLSRSRHEEAINIVSFLEDNGNNAPDGFSLLHAAAKCGSLEMARYLINHRGLYVDVADSNGSTPLITAVINYSEDMVRFLVEHGADVNTVNRFGETPLWWAIENSHGNVAEYLAAHGADVAYRHPDEELSLCERGEMLGLKI
jgi:ankyrin repeat protein